MTKKQVRFSSQTGIMNEKSNDKPTNSEVNSEQNAAENDNSSCEDEAVDSMWEKLVLYYLARLKGMCDWRSYSWSAQGRRGKYYTSSTHTISSSVSENLENHIINKVTKQVRKNSTPVSNRYANDVATFMAAGYEEGKQQATKIVIRSLKFGLLTGILEKTGNVYKIRAKYLNKWKPHCKSFKRSYNRKQNYKKNARDCKKQNYGNTKNMTLRSGKKVKKNLKRKYSSEKECCDSGMSTNEKKCNAEQIFYDKNSRSKERSVSPLLSSRSTSFKSNSSERAGPSAKRKDSRRDITQPVLPRPSGKKRGRSQTKSPTPSKSRSKTSITKYKPRKLKSTHKHEQVKYHTPEPRRCSSVLSSISRSSSSMSFCAICKGKRVREHSDDSRASYNVKKFKQSFRPNQ